MSSDLTDLWGPSRIESHSGARYFLSLVDDYSRKLWIYVLKSKDELFNTFKSWKVLIENQSNRKVKRLRSDNGLEFCSAEFNNFCRDNGIVRHRTTVGTPQQNGLAERFNRTILERVRCMLVGASLPKVFWAEAVMTAGYLINRCPSTALGMKTPEEVWSGRPADYERLRVFGCSAYAHIRQDKLEPRALRCILIGYPEGVKGYRLWCMEPGYRKCIISRDVVFNELEMGYNRDFAESKKKSVEVEPFNLEMENHNSGSGDWLRTDNDIQGRNDDDEAQNDIDDVQDLQSDSEMQNEVQNDDDSGYMLTRDRVPRQRRAPDRYGYAELLAYSLVAASEVLDDEPKSVSTALASKDSKKWLDAMKEEMKSLHDNKTWTLVKRPFG